MTHRLLHLMRDVTRLTRAGELRAATAALQRAWRPSGPVPQGPQAPQTPGAASAPAPAPTPQASSVASPTTSRAATPEPVGASSLDAAAPPVAEAPPPPPTKTATRPAQAELPFPEPAPEPSARPSAKPSAWAPGGPGVLASGQHCFAGLVRAYKLYTPARAKAGFSSPGAPLPLVVMLHGCKQNADDFAAGTGMNDWADRQGFVVLYPEQSSEANAHGCWQWFAAKHQQRGEGEAGFLADLTRHIVEAQGLDPLRVYVAGLSAGGAMAAVLGAAYPDLFAAVGVHSGLAPGAAHSLPEALLAMNGGLRSSAIGMPFQGAASPRAVALPLPVIVFHGDDDSVVHPNNSGQVIAAVRWLRPGDASRASAPASAASPVRATAATREAQVAQVAADTEQGGGRRVTRSVHAAGPEHPASEHWLVHGAGHAWSGGRARGSFTDHLGPDASEEMLRFFMLHRRSPSAKA